MDTGTFLILMIVLHLVIVGGVVWVWIAWQKYK